jgi:hypothetical protein
VGDLVLCLGGQHECDEVVKTEHLPHAPKAKTTFVRFGLESSTTIILLNDISDILTSKAFKMLRDEDLNSS